MAVCVANAGEGFAPGCAMIWNDKQIAAVGERMVTPFVGQQVRELHGHKVVSYGVSSFGYDVRLGVDFRRVAADEPGVLDPKNMEEVWWHAFTDFTVDILPGECVLGVTYERVVVPENVMVLCVGKSTYARLGLVVNTTPLEPGWEGHVTLELSNTNSRPLRVYAGEGIAQLMFFEGERPMVTYGDRGGKYQNQEDVPVLARV